LFFERTCNSSDSDTRGLDETLCCKLGRLSTLMDFELNYNSCKHKTKLLTKSKEVSYHPPLLQSTFSGFEVVTDVVVSVFNDS
jgi:hypothetical protein